MAKTEIKEIKEGMKGLFATRTIYKDTLIFLLNGKKLSKPTRTSIQVKNKHVEHHKGGFMNHHCSPNAEVLLMKGEKMAFVMAKETIKKGEEITFDYETTEEELVSPFKCECHGKLIVGWNIFQRI